MLKRRLSGGFRCASPPGGPRVMAKNLVRAEEMRQSQLDALLEGAGLHDAETALFGDGSPRGDLPP